MLVKVSDTTSTTLPEIQEEISSQKLDEIVNLASYLGVGQGDLTQEGDEMIGELKGEEEFFILIFLSLKLEQQYFKSFKKMKGDLIMKNHNAYKTNYKMFYFTKHVLQCMLLLTAFIMTSSLAFAETITVGKDLNHVTLLSSRSDVCVVDVTIGKFERKEVMIGKEKYFSISLPGETLIKEKGNPELPKLSRSISIPGDTGVFAKVEKSQYVDYEMQIAPSKGIVTRNINLKEIPFSFGETYKKNQFYPQSIVTLGEPYLLREVRGTAVNISPFAYNPVTKVLRVYTNLTIKILFEGQDDRNTLKRSNATFNKYFAPVYEHHFINIGILDDQLDILTTDDIVMLVIADDDFTDEMIPFVDHKNDIGVTTEMISMSDVGSTTDDIQDYIQDYYDTHDSLTYVLFVGDNAQIPTPMYLGGGSDPSYSLLSGSDNYPDIFIGRFSAENGIQVETMVERSIIYETTGKGAWFHNGMGVASSQGTGNDGEYDYEHLQNIRTILLDWHYTNIGEFYDGSQGGGDAANNPTPASIATSVDNGVSIINYTGHGSTTTWTSSGFSNADVNDLINDNELPFIFSVACVNGNFTGSTCFAETWLRAQNGATGNPTGAIGFYGSTINQSWSPPMEAQDEFNNMLSNEDVSSFGALCYNASAAMMDAYGGGNNQSGTNMFLTWHFFGDPSINVGRPCFPDLPEPVLSFKGTTKYSVGSKNYIRYNLQINNWSSYPNLLFEPAPHLPVCGLNTNSSRTWVNIYNGSTGQRLYGFCGLDSNDDLTKLWFSIPEGSSAPSSVYVVIDDREYDNEYVSKSVLTKLKLYPYYNSIKYSNTLTQMGK